MRGRRRVRRQTVVAPRWIEVAGYKSLRTPTRIEMCPLTLLAGGNSSGKSSAIQPLLLLKQSLEAPFDPDPLLLDGPHVRFTRLEQFLSRGHGDTKEVDGFSVTIGPCRDGERRPVVDTKFERRFAFERSGQKDRLRFRYAIRKAGTSDAWIAFEAKNKEKIAALLEEDSEEGACKRSRVKTTRKRKATESGVYGLRLRFFFSAIERSDRKRNEYSLRDLAVFPWGGSLDWVRSAFHLPGHRGHRERRYPIANVGIDRTDVTFVQGPVPPYAASFLLNWGRLAHEKDERAKERLDWVNDALKQLGLTWKVVVKPAGAAELEVRVGRLPKARRGGARDVVDLADVGFGVSQVLPVLVALAAAVPGQMVFIEQPELHLHPRAQLQLGRLLARTAARGVIVVLETHSPLILRVVQTSVALGELKPEDVGLHWFSRDEETGWSEVRKAQVKKDGSFGPWPVDFPDVFADADKALIEAVFSRDGRQG